MTLVVAASLVATRTAPVSRGVHASCGSPQVMLYMSQPLGFRGAGAQRLYGLRVEELHNPSRTTQLVATAPSHRELLDLQVAASDVRVRFARRLLWNVTRQNFGPQSGQTVVQVGVAIRGIRLADSASPQPWDAAASALAALPGNPIPRRQVDGGPLMLLDLALSPQRAATDSSMARLQIGPARQPAPDPTRPVDSAAERLASR